MLKSKVVDLYHTLYTTDETNDTDDTDDTDPVNLNSSFHSIKHKIKESNREINANIIKIKIIKNEQLMYTYDIRIKHLKKAIVEKDNRLEEIKKPNHTIK